MVWEYVQPVRVIFGCGKKSEVKKIAASAGLGRGVLVCDKVLVDNGTAKSLTDELGGLIAGTFVEFCPNPTVDSVDACADAIRVMGADFVAVLGGGSAIDVAKAAAVTAKLGQSIKNYHATGVMLPDSGLPIIALPATAGTGSEVTPVSVLTDEVKGIKSPIICQAFYPMAAIIDPELTYTVPPKVAAQTGIDVLCHAVEAYMSINNQPICDALAIQATRLVFEHLTAAATGDKTAKGHMALASLLAGLAFGQPKTGAPHACSFVLTNRYGIAHGEACALTLDYFLEIAAIGERQRLQSFAIQTGFEDIARLAEKIRELKKELGLMANLKHLNLTDEDIKALIKDSRHPNMNNSPVEITDEMLSTLYQRIRT